MAENIQRGRGRGQAYKYDKGGVPAEFGPFIGIIKSTFDSTRSGRLRVYIEAFGGQNPDSESNWRTVNYLPHFYGATEHAGQNVGTGIFEGNRHTYGMWMTPPDVGSRVFCFFADGDPNKGYYTGCVPEEGLGHMVPAIAGSSKYTPTDPTAEKLLGGSSSVPVIEINSEDPAIFEDSRFWDKEKPVHSVHAYTMFQQGLLDDKIRGPISSSSQRESPSAVFGISTPGTPIYSGGYSKETLRPAIEAGEVTSDQIKVIGRNGGHTFVMDDGDIDGNDQLVRIRTSKGHQITMSDDGDCFYITHANGQSWLEFGKEGTVDVFSTNSVNVRTQGTINLHADEDINMYAGKDINMMSKARINTESLAINLRAENELKAYSKMKVMLRSDQTLALDAGKTGSFDGGDSLSFTGGSIGLNSGGSIPVTPVTAIPKNKVSDSKFNGTKWESVPGELETTNTRVPTHEPWPFHNLGTANSINLSGPQQTPLTPLTAGAVSSVADVAPVGANLEEITTLPKAPKGIETLNTDQVTGLEAQLSKDVGQSLDQISVDKGIGKFGVDSVQLEQAGYLVPGTNDRFIKDPSKLSTDSFGKTTTQLEKTLSSGTVWTNKGGATDLNSFLGDEVIQQSAVQDVYTSNVSTLRAKGVIKGTEAPADLGGILNASVEYGVEDTAKWANGEYISPTVDRGIKQAVRNGQYVVGFVDEKITPDLSGFGSPGGYSGTTNRDTLANAGKALINSDKVPKPKY